MIYDIMQVFLVTGGRGSRSRFLSSTEIFVGSVWSFAASLPSKISDMPALTLDNSVFVFGEFPIEIIYILQQIND